MRRLLWLVLLLFLVGCKPSPPPKPTPAVNGVYSNDPALDPAIVAAFAAAQ